MVSSFSGDSTTINERFSGGGGESAPPGVIWVVESFEFCDVVVFEGVSDSKALAAVRLIPLLVQGTAAECIIAKRS